MFEPFNLKVFCTNCGGHLEDTYRFCVFCGNATNVPSFYEEENEEDILLDYFSKGFTYEKIRMFLETKHNKTLSIRTLKSRLTAMGLKRRNVSYNMANVRA